jgi:hypothetical protein
LNNWFEKVKTFLNPAKNFPKILATTKNSYGICFRFFELKTTMAVNKKRVIKSLDNLNEDLKELLKKQYPNGYEGSITRIAAPKKEPMFVFPLETDDAIYLVKVPVTKNSDGEYDVDKGGEEEFGSSEGVAAAGGEASDYGNADDFSGSSDGDGDDYDEDGGSGRKSGGEASYDPDFDD